MPLTAITDVASLKANISDYLARDDLEYAYDSWIQTAENRLSSALKVPGMEKTSTLTLAADGTVNFPTDYVEWVAVRWTGSGAGARSQGLRYAEANAPEFTFRYRPNGDPQFYTVAGGKVAIRPVRAGTVDLIYYARIPALTSTNTTNWLLQRSPQLYLYSVLAEGYAFQKDEEKAKEWMQAADERLKLFIAEGGSAKVGRRAEREAEIAAELRAAKAPT